MENINLDIKNQKILKALRFNGRNSFSKIAKEIGLNKETTIYRINQLEKQKIILNYLPEINTTLLGYTIFRIVIKLKSMNKEFENKLEKYLIESDMPVVWIGYVYGEWDFALGIMVKDINKFYTYMENFNKHFGEHILKKSLVIQVEDTFKHYSFLYGPNKGIKKISKIKINKNVEFDEMDLKLIGLLYENGRIPIIEISKKLKLSSDVVRYKLDKLKKNNIIKKIITTMDRNKLGFRKYKVLLSFQNMSVKDHKKILGYCNEHYNVSHVTSCIGTWDMEIDYDAKNHEEFNNLFMQLRDMFNPIIHDYSILLNYRYEYLNPFGNLIREKRNL